MSFARPPESCRRLHAIGGKDDAAFFPILRFPESIDDAISLLAYIRDQNRRRLDRFAHIFWIDSAVLWTGR